MKDVSLIRTLGWLLLLALFVLIVRNTPNRNDDDEYRHLKWEDRARP